jgi:hypothetical protein
VLRRRDSDKPATQDFSVAEPSLGLVGVGGLAAAKSAAAAEVALVSTPAAVGAGAAGAEVAGAGAGVGAAGTVSVAALGAVVMALASIGLAAYEWHKVWVLYKEVQKGKADSERLKEYVDRQVFLAWQNGEITDEEYQNYKASGVLNVEAKEKRRNDGADRRAFRDWVVRTILAGYDGQEHPLRKLLDKDGKPYSAGNMYDPDHPIFDAGHLRSHHGGGAAMGVEWSPDNRLDGSKSEGKGVIFEKVFVDVGGIPIEKGLLQTMENHGLVAKGTLAGATPSKGWIP